MAFAGCCKWMNLSKRMRTVSIILAHRAVVIQYQYKIIFIQIKNIPTPPLTTSLNQIIYLRGGLSCSYFDIYQQKGSLFHIQIDKFENMHEYSSIRSGIFSGQLSGQSKETQVLRSMQLKSEVQSSGGQEGELLMMRLLMLSIEIDRKDNIIRELLMATSNNEHQIVIEDLNKKCHLYQLEIRTLSETVQMLKENITIIESNKNKEVFHSISQFNEELENKAYGLQTKLRKVQEEKIELEEQLKQNKLNQSMAEFKLIKNEQTEKGKVRELQKLLSNERVKLQTERRTVGQKNLLIQELKNRLIQFDNNQKYIINQYQDKVRMIKQELVHHEDLKRSQIHSNQQKHSLFTVQITRLSQEIRYLKQTLDNQRQNSKNRDKESNKLTTQIKILQSKYQKVELQYRQLLLKYQNKINDLKNRQKQIGQKEMKITMCYNQTEELRFLMSNKSSQMELYNEEIKRFRSQMSELYSINDQQKLQIRKLKRKPLQSLLCQNCKLKEFGSCSVISSEKSIKTMNITDIIHQTEQLIQSNRKIQNMISSRQPGYESSIQVYHQYHL